MDSMYCDVIGCTSLMRWILADNRGSRRETFLCDRCMQNLQRIHPEQASHYQHYAFQPQDHKSSDAYANIITDRAVVKSISHSAQHSPENLNGKI